MKKLILTMLCSLMILQFTAQQKNVTTFKTTNWLKFDAKTTFAEQSAKQLVQNKHQLNLQKEDDLSLQKTTTDQLGYKHYRYQQTYKDIIVVGANYLMHEKNGIVKFANGKLVEQLNINTKAALTESAALQFALQHMNATLYAWNVPLYETTLQQVEQDSTKSFYPCGELVIVDPAFQQQAADYRLAYKFDIYAVEPLSRQMVYVDAQNGNIVTAIEQIKNSDVPASGASNYSGTISFTADYTNGLYTLKQSNPVMMQVFSANYIKAFPQIPITSETNFLNSDQTANEVHWGTGSTYNYFKDTLGRNGIDNNNMPMYSWVHFGKNYNNAFWNGNWMVYGDGDNIRFSSLTSVDIVAHEITHGITQYSAGLKYRNEPGALNESFSDIFGEVVEAYVKGSNDWIIGAEPTLQAGKNGIRNLSNPNDPNMLTQQPDTYKGDFWYSGLGDYGGVHYNSGVQNYWFYLLSQGGNGTNDQEEDYAVEGIGMDKAAAIAYRNLTVYLTENSQYADAREGAIQAAKDLYGEDSFEAEQTKLAWCAVGVGTCAPEIECKWRATDSLALRALYFATAGEKWTNSWDLERPMNEWYGVGLNSKGRVYLLQLPDNNLVGNIPPEIGDLCYLETLRLRSNQLSGNIPSSIEELVNLERLELNNNNLTGIIPVELYSLNNLKELSVTNNGLSGSLSSLIGNLVNLEWLNLYNNNFTGSIPAEIGDLDKLSYLSLGGNELSGCYHKNLLKLCDQFEAGSLHMNGNNFDVSWEDFCASGTSICPPLVCSREADSLALRIFYFATDGPNWTNPWDLMQPMDTWYGIRLENGRVTGIDLKGLVNFSWQTNKEGNNLKGIIPSEIGNLCELTYLNLGDNNLSGNIPLEIGNLDKLTNLTLTRNKFTGIIPPAIGNLTNLINLNIGANELIGTIPPEIGNLIKLRSLYLSYNNLSGIIPPELCNLTELKVLGLSSNQLSGSIPTEILCSPYLTDIQLANNQLTGAIPPEIGEVSTLTNLSLRVNQLTGAIPATFVNLTNLTLFDVNDNNLIGCYDTALTELCDILSPSDYFNGNEDVSDDNNFDATWEEFCANEAGVCIPVLCNRTTDSLALRAFYFATDGPNWTYPWDLNQPMDTWYGIRLENGRVTCIDLDGDPNCDYYSDNGNNLIGTLPPEIGDLCELTYLNLNDNDLAGNIPPEIGKLSKLNYLSLVRCQLIGTIPAELGNLIELRGLSLGGNQLSGNIPSSLSNLSNLTSLTLYFNDLSGEIPVELSNLSNLENLGLDNNQLSGSIPPQFGNLINLAVLGLSNNQLSGTIPTELCNLLELGNLGLSNNQLSGSIPSCFSNLTGLSKFDVNDNNLSGCYDAALTQLCDILSPSDYFNGNEDVSDGNNFDATWEEFCLDGISSCESTSPVYPGDFNNDGIVNITDLLYWGLAEGEMGSVRPNAKNDWEAQYCPDWNQEINGVNTKHQDGDGDGVVDSDDLIPLHDNFYKRHSGILPRITGSPVEFSLKQVSSKRRADGTIIDTFYLSVKNDLGNSFSTHGLTCSIYLGDLPVNSVEVDFGNSSIQPSETIYKYHNSKNVLDIGLTRTDKTNVPVDNIVAKIIAISIELPTAEPYFVTIGGGNTMSGNGKLSQVDGRGVFIAPYYEGIDLDATFPLTVNTSDEHYIRKGTAEAIPLGGQPPYTYAWSTGSSSSKVSDLKAGDYSITVTDALNASATLSFKIRKFGYNMVKCPETNEVNICAPVSPLPPLNLAAFETINEEYFTGNLSMEIDTLFDVQENFTSNIYVYIIYDETGMQQTCHQQYNIANQFLQAPDVTQPSVVCEEDLWSYIKIGAEKYIIYKDENGSIGKKLSICETPGLICSTADFEVDTDIPGRYYFWATEFIRFPDSEICESEATRFYIDIEAKPIAGLSTQNQTLNIGESIALMGLVTENETGYWTGENIIYLMTPEGENISIFSANSGGTYKLYYTVTNQYCEYSYLLIVNVADNRISINKEELVGLNGKSIPENEPICSDDQFKIFPNPSANKKLHVIPKCTKNFNTQYSIRIFDLSGNVMIQKQFTDQMVRLNLSTFKKGMYMVELRSAEYQSIQKLLIE